MEAGPLGNKNFPRREICPCVTTGDELCSSNVASKVLRKIVLERMKDSLDDRLRDEQDFVKRDPTVTRLPL